jgi:hypothetical protein
MAKSTKKRASKSPTAASTAAAKPVTPAGNDKQPKATAPSKQSRVIAMLQAPAGVTIAAMMKATGWQQHSVRGFLAGVVRKRLKLKLESKKNGDGERVYLIAGAGGGKSPGAKPKRRSS